MKMWRRGRGGQSLGTPSILYRLCLSLKQCQTMEMGVRWSSQTWVNQQSLFKVIGQRRYERNLSRRGHSHLAYSEKFTHTLLINLPFWFSLLRPGVRAVNKAGTDWTIGQRRTQKNTSGSVKCNATCCQSPENVSPHVGSRGSDEAERRLPQLSNQWVTCQSTTSCLLLLFFFLFFLQKVSVYRKKIKLYSPLNPTTGVKATLNSFYFESFRSF